MEGMMKKNIVIILVALVISLHSFVAYSQDEEDNSDSIVPPGMVREKIGGATVVIPHDSWVHKRGDEIVLEDINAYVARKMLDVEERLTKIEDDLEAMHEELRQSKNSAQQ